MRARFGEPGFDAPGDEVVASVCEMCFWKCGIRVHKQDGVATKIEGNPAHPLSRGRLCPRGTGALGNLYDPDRLRVPLIREGERGEDRFREATWEEALDRVAEGLRGVIETHGPQAIAMLYHGAGGSFFKTLVKALGSANIAAPSYAQCRGPREAGFELTFGEGLGSPEPLDLANAKCVALIGSHLGENMHNTQVQDFAEGLSKGMRVITVDPRFSTAAGKSAWWLPIRPGTDMALLLGWANLLIQEGWYDRAFVEQHATGFDQLAAEVARYTPEAVFVETGIRPDVLRATARELAQAAPSALVHPGRHVTWYGDDSQRSRAIAIVNALLGNWGALGGFYLTSKSELKGFPGEPAAHPEAPAADRKEGQYVFANENVASGLRDATLTGEPYPIHAWLVYGSNLPNVLPDARKTYEAIQKLDFMVAIDILPAEICGWADVVLPECTYLERYDDLIAPFHREPFIALRQPVVEPLGDSKPGWWMAKELAKRLGVDAYFPWEDPRELIEERMRATGYDEAQVATLFAEGALRTEPAPLYFAPGEAYEWGTPSGKIELWSQQLADMGFDPVPVHRRPAQPGPGEFRLLFGRAPVHTFGRTTNNARLLQQFPENELWINRSVAQDLGLRNGQPVMVTNQDGATTGPIKVKATERIRHDCVYMVHGFGHTSKHLRRAFGVGANDAALVTRYEVDPLMGGTGMNVNFVTLEAVEG
ncbi:MAG: molybdopterin-dependent oxidoreductase [Planctomycetes bacterium]|nr:molybdopterin-dependent oxidoreductase [Planctomycetota bacterium]